MNQICELGFWNNSLGVINKARKYDFFLFRFSLRLKTACGKIHMNDGAEGERGKFNWVPLVFIMLHHTAWHSILLKQRAMILSCRGSDWLKTKEWKRIGIFREFFHVSYERNVKNLNRNVPSFNVAENEIVNLYRVETLICQFSFFFQKTKAIKSLFKSLLP